METSLVNRLQATLLAAATVALFLLAIGNFTQETKFQQPVDGVWWVEAHGGMIAQRVDADGPGKHAGIQVHDLLTAIDDTPIHNLSDFESVHFIRLASIAKPITPSHVTISHWKTRLKSFQRRKTAACRISTA